MILFQKSQLELKQEFAHHSFFLLSCFRCTVDLSLLSREHTHKLELPLEDGKGVLVLLVTLTASAAVSISDLSVNMLDDPHERHHIMQRYVSHFQ